MRQRRADILLLLTMLAAGAAAAADGRYRLRLADPAQYVLTDPARVLALRPHGDILRKAAEASAVDPALLHAIVAVESGYDPQAVSPKGAAGLMQLMPETARRYGARENRNPAQNAFAGSAYLKDLLIRFDHDLALALAAYNAGEHAVLKYGRKIPPYRETRAYVPRVLEAYRANQHEATGPYRLRADWAGRLTAARE